MTDHSQSWSVMCACVYLDIYLDGPVDKQIAVTPPVRVIEIGKKFTMSS